MAYSIDISYYSGESTDANVFDITSKYHDCEWYAADTGPFVMNGPYKKICRNNGFKIDSLETLKKIITEVNAQPNIWIDFCTKSIDNGEDCEHIYNSNNRLNSILPKFAYEYHKRVKNYTGTDKEIFDLCNGKN